jgi:hypothetical protein
MFQILYRIYPPKIASNFLFVSALRAIKVFFTLNANNLIINNLTENVFSLYLLFSIDKFPLYYTKFRYSRSFLTFLSREKSSRAKPLSLLRITHRSIYIFLGIYLPPTCLSIFSPSRLYQLDTGASLVVSFNSDLLTLQAFYLHFLFYYYKYNYMEIFLVTYTFLKVFYNFRTINSSFAI